jgi:hypothetical protein
MEMENMEGLTDLSERADLNVAKAVAGLAHPDTTKRVRLRKLKSGRSTPWNELALPRGIEPLFSP